MDVDVLIIGAGVVGLACAREFARHRYSTLLVEQHQSFGQETSSRNSEVIHSGIYYQPGSLKARLCMEANKNLYAECERTDVWHRRCGKLIVAVTEEEEPEMERLYQRSLTNGVEEIEIIDAAQAKKLEPNIRCRSALHLRSTGIVDSHQLMKAYLREAQEFGATVAFGIEYVGVERQKDGYRAAFKDSNGVRTNVASRMIVNAAGLHAEKVAQTFGINIDAAGYRMHPNRGHYFRVSSSKSKLVSRLVYPLPHPRLVSVGIHIVIDKAGQCKVGPDAEYLNGSMLESEWYKFDESRKEKFYCEVVRYFPSLTIDDLSPDQIGVRPKIQGPGDPARDFIIADERDKGLPGVVNLIGIESPGLTCSAEIAKEVLKKLSHN